MRFQVIAACAIALATQVTAAEPRTEEAVIAADHAWGRAELAGNAAFLNKLLLPGYVSISPDGRAITRQQIVNSAARKTKDQLAQDKVRVDAWKAAHPERAEVSIVGDTAVLKWVSVKGGEAAPVLSSDIFVYQGGGWHAIYSQHSSATS